MSLLDTLKGLFAGSSATSDASGPSSALHIIDTSAPSGGNAGRERPSPRDLFNTLQQVNEFVSKEKIKASVVLEGRELREATHGSTFKNVKVYYAEKPEELAKLTLDLARKGGRNSIIVTQNRDIEKRAHSAGIATLRTSTVRKAMDDHSGGGRNGDGGRGNGGGGRNRRRQRPPRRGNGGGGGGGGGNRPEGNAPRPQPEASKPKEAPAKDGVSDLIDLV